MERVERMGPSSRSGRSGATRRLAVRLAASVLVVGLSTMVLPSGAGAKADANRPLARTRDGWVRGSVSGSVQTWAGIPYAAPPLGELRWRPPAPPQPWTGVRNAMDFAEPCIQQIGPEEFLGSEDCLYLNVFTPDGANSLSDLPVMVHLHPGSNSGFHPYTNADAFVAHGVVVVTLGYRLGVFGWVGHPTLREEGADSSGEYGILDQIAALQWVRDNIAGFGGDPSNVTLFGDSAGSFDATAIVASPVAQGLVQKAALQTESWWALMGPDIAEAEEIGIYVARRVGCSGTPDVAACLRALPAETLVEAAGFLDIAPWVGGVVLPKSPLELISKQEAAIPLLVGSNREEASLGWFYDFVQGLAQYKTKFWFFDTNAIAGPKRGAKVRRLYPLAHYESPLWSAVTFFSDAIYGCPIRHLALASNGPVWRYLYTHTYQNSDYFGAFRAGHFLDDPILWHDVDLLSGFGQPTYELSADEEALAANMATYWTNFAKAGDPNNPGLPEWPMFRRGHERSLLLDQQLGEIDRYHRKECMFWDKVPELFPAPGQSFVPRGTLPETGGAVR